MLRHEAVSNGYLALELWVEPDAQAAAANTIQFWRSELHVAHSRETVEPDWVTLRTVKR